MLIPTKLSDWNYDVIQNLASKYLETNTFDFKFTIKSLDPKTNQSIINTACAFANTNGGFLVFGVNRKDDAHYVIEGLDKSDNYAKEFGDKISSINPTIHFNFLNPPISIPKSNKILFVAEIPLSKDRPHMTENGVFYYRTNKGNEIMDYEQVKEAFLRYEERKHKLRFLYTELLYNNRVADSISGFHGDPGGDSDFPMFSTEVITNLMPDIYMLIQDNPDLIRKLFDLREGMGAVNLKISAYYSEMMAKELDGIEFWRRRHGFFVRQIGNKIKPTINEIKSILEKEYDIKTPLN
jgi:hypothetical protein